MARSPEAARAIREDYLAGLPMAEIAAKHGFQRVDGIYRYIVGMTNRRVRLVDPVTASALRAEGFTFAEIARVYSVTAPAVLQAIRRHERGKQ